MKQITFEKIKEKNLMNIGILCEKNFNNKFNNNEEKMIKYYEEAINRYKNVEAMYRLGRYYYSKKKFGKMLIYLLMAINRKCTKSMVLLSNYCREKKEIDNFFKYSNMAIKLGNENAMFLRGIYHLKNKEYDEMIKYLNLAVEKNYVDAMIELAYYYREIKDIKNMKKYFLLAVANKSSEAMHELGNYYEEIKNYKLMEKYFLLASIHGEIEAMLDLGSFYFLQKKNILKAIKFYKMAMAKNSAEAMYRMGTILYKPFKKNNEALKYFLMCIDNDYFKKISEAYFMAGIIYLETGMIKEAEKMFLIGIDLENKDCYCYYASIICYKIKKDFEKAVKYAILSLDKFNDLRMCETLGDYYKKIKNYDEMKKYYLMDIGSKDCRNKLGNYYEYIEKDFNEALIYYSEEEKENMNSKIKNYHHIIEKCKIINNDNCYICDNEYDEIFKLNCCNQIICKKCICGILNRNLNFSCPYCRYTIEFQNTKHNSFETESDDENFINGIYYQDEVRGNL
jgi:TPR repeat protein